MTGFLADRLGRKPLVLMGPTIRGLSNIGQFFSDDYVTFFVYEIIGQVGVAMWATSSNVLLSDVTNVASRGRVLALRQMATRLGFVAGPAVGGVSAALFGLESVFLINGISKVVIVVVVLAMVKETRPEEARRVAPGTRRPPFTLAPFKDRAFLVVAICTAVFAMSNAGLMQTLVPVHAVGAFELDPAVDRFPHQPGVRHHVSAGISQRPPRRPVRAQVVARAGSLADGRRVACADRRRLLWVVAGGGRAHRRG